MPRKIGVHPDDLRDLLDLAYLAQISHIAKRCVGGRYVMDGYMCSHCDADPTHVTERDGKRYRQCGAPKKKNVKPSTLVEDLRNVFPVEG